MSRYFLEVSYKGTRYSGFQVQANAVSVQGEVEKAFGILHRGKVEMTGSSRTDAGVHARQNYFHFDWEKDLHPQFEYKMNAILPPDIVVHAVYPVADDAHCRFMALSRAYRYYIYREKDPFLEDRAYYFPYSVDLDKMKAAAEMVKQWESFRAFSKRNTQVHTFKCKVEESEWLQEGGMLVYHVKANRFLRGMVRALTATMLKVGRGKLSLDEFAAVQASEDCTMASFAVPAHGLFLEAVHFPPGVVEKS